MTSLGHTRNWQPCRKCGKVHGPPAPNIPREIDLTPDFDLGGITGIVLGDGNVISDKKNRGIVRLGSTEKSYVDLFTEVTSKRFPNLTVGRQDEWKTYRVPSGKWVTGHVYWARIYSKRLFEFFRPHKMNDYHWTIPPMILSNIVSKRGFLQGIYDAEGSISIGKRGKYTICLASKHKSNLIPIQEFLTALGINGAWDMHNQAVLRISGRNQCIQFGNKIGFRIARKAEKLPTTFKRRWRNSDLLPWEMKTEW